MKAKTIIEKTGQDGLDTIDALMQAVVAAAVDVGCTVTYGRAGNWTVVNQHAPGPVGDKVRVTHNTEGLEVEVYVNYIKYGEIYLSLAISDLNDDHFRSAMKGETPKWDAITANVFSDGYSYTEYFKDPNPGTRVSSAALWTGTQISRITSNFTSRDDEFI